MRQTLFAAVALAPLLLGAAPALAATSIDSSTTSPVATSTTGDLTITTGGAIKTSTAGVTAVTLDSNNTVTNAGTIDVENASNSTAVLIQGGLTGGFTTTGTVENIEDFTPTDTNSDGVVEAPLASGSGRYGVRMVGPSVFIGSVTTGGSIFVEGNDSTGVSIESPLFGSIFHSGTIGVTGDRSFGLRTLAPVAGDINLTGQVGASGQGSTAVSIGGDVGGALKIYAPVLANAYSTATRSTVEATLKIIQATASELQQSGAALVVAANIANGLYLAAPPVGTATTSTADVDGDGIVDSLEGTGTLSNYGSSPALVVGAPDRSVTLGAFGTGANAYGVILRGTISTAGLYDGVSSTAIQIGGVGGAANLVGGLRLTGTVFTSAYEAAATALRVGAGGSVPELRIENSLSASVLHSTVGTASNATATAVLIEAGGALSTLTNYGTIAATASGPSANASAVVDQSGTLTNIVNQGAIAATLVPATTGAATGGQTIALDLRANTAGVTLVQSANPSPILLATVTSTTNTVVNTTTPPTPSIGGDVLLGSGPNTVQILSGTLTGALNLGSGAAALTVGSGATVTGALSHAGSALSLNVAGSLINTNATVLQASSLTLSSGGLLSFAIDPANARAGGYTVSGAANLAAGAKIGVTLISNQISEQTYTLIKAGSLSIGSLDSLITSTPYLTIASLRADAAGGTLNLDLRRRTAVEAQLNTAETAAYDAVYAALPKDASIQGALFGATDHASFTGLYDQLLPDYGGGVFRLASAAARATSRAAAEGPESGWLQEITVGARQQASSGALPYRAGGIGLAGGVEREAGVGLVGLSTGFFTGTSRVRDQPGDNYASLTQLQLGLTWRAQFGGLSLNARGGGAYDHYNFQRQFVVLGSTGTAALTRTAKATSSGWSADGSFGVGYRITLGRLYIEPNAHLDYLRLTQGGYAETGGGDALDLDVSRRIGQETSGTVAVRAGAVFGQEFRWRPELEVGYRDVFSGTPGSVTANFNGGSSFTLAPALVESGGGLARLGVNAGNELYDLSLSAGVESRSGYAEGDVHVRARLLF